MSFTNTKTIIIAGKELEPPAGLSFTNYYAYLINDDLPWKEPISAPWAHRGAYVLPTPEQAEATAQLIGWLTSEAAVGLDIPRKWVGIERGLVRMGSIPGAERPSPGIWAHHYFDHADGAWPVFYAWLRLEAGHDPDSAFETGTIRAAGVRRTIDVLELTDNWTNRED